MRLFSAATLLLLSAFVATPDRSDAQDACGFYRIKQGDTLREISQAAYGFDNHIEIWRENRSEIGRNPNIIEIGVVLKLPCAEGQEPETAAASSTDTSSDKAVISFVTANGYLPYTDESLARQGLITDLVRMAMKRSGSETEIEVVFVNDWAAHMEELLPRQAFDASFPWTRPNCEAAGSLSSAEANACENYQFSEPMYDIVDGFFSKAGRGYENVIAYDGFEGATICRPEGYSTAHLEENGLTAPSVRIVQPASTHACFEMLMSGQADIVALDTRAGERVMNDLSLTFHVAENPHLFAIQPLQVAVHNNNPRGGQVIEDLNRGLRQMLTSGEWASIVTEGLQARPKALVN